VLDCGLRQFPSADARAKELKTAIINALWPPADISRTITAIENHPELESFFKYYIRQTSSIASTVLKLEAVTHRKLLEIARLIGDKTKTRAEIRNVLLQRNPPNAAALELKHVEVLLELAARISLLVYVDKTLRASRVESITWADDKTVGDFIDAAIPVKEITGPEAGNVSLSDSMPGICTASQASKFHGPGIYMNICKMDEDDRKIKIFHLASVLRQVQGSAGNGLPKDLAAETLDTLSLLLPSDDEDTKEWYFREQMQTTAERPMSQWRNAGITYFRLGLRSWGLRRVVTLPQLNPQSLWLDPSATRCSRLPDFARRIKHYKYWGERLEYLVQVYYDHEPRSLKQWARDDRRPAQRTSFWVTVGAFLLALMSLSLTAVQTWRLCSN
jgi:hypothetical protein